MSDNRILTKGEFMAILEESAKNEFKAKFGNGAKRNSQDNEKATSEIRKKAEAYDNAGRKPEPKRKNVVDQPDWNKTTMDVNFEYEASDAYKERVMAQAMGYPSVFNMENNDYDPALDFEGNKRFFDTRKKTSSDKNKRDTVERESGLKAKEKKDVIDYNNKTMYEGEMHQNMNMFKKDHQRLSAMTVDSNDEPGSSMTREDEFDNDLPQGTGRRFHSGPAVNESKPTKRLVFKNTQFLSEAQVLSRVPEEYKIDENRFYMRDKTGTDYLVECQADPFGFVHMQIVNKINKQQINEELAKMQRLAGYSYGDDNKKVDKTQLGDMSESINSFRELLRK